MPECIHSAFSDCLLNELDEMRLLKIVSGNFLPVMDMIKDLDSAELLFLFVDRF
jgi:hypothetical protein